MWENLENENKGLVKKSNLLQVFVFSFAARGRTEREFYCKTSAVQLCRSVFNSVAPVLCAHLCSVLWVCDSKVCTLVALKLQRSYISESSWIDKLISSFQQIRIVRCQWYSAIPLPPILSAKLHPKVPHLHFLSLEGQSTMQLLFTSDPLKSDSLGSGQWLTVWSAFTRFSKATLWAWHAGLIYLT